MTTPLLLATTGLVSLAVIAIVAFLYRDQIGYNVRLLNAKIVGCTPKAESFGIHPGMTGREAVERMLAAKC